MQAAQDYVDGCDILTPAEKADVEFEISKNLAGPMTAKFLTKGSIGNFHTNTEMKFEKSKLTKFGQKNPDMQGELILNLTN